MRSKGKKAPIKLLIYFFKDFKWIFVLSIICLIISSYLSTIVPTVMKIIIDSVIGELPFDMPEFLVSIVESIGGRSTLVNNLWICALFLVLLTAVSGLFTYFRGYLSGMVTEGVGKKMKDEMFFHILRLPYHYHVKHNTGDLIQRCTSDIENIQGFLGNQFTAMLQSVFTFAFVFFLMFSMSPSLTLISLVSMPLVFVFTFFIFRNMSGIWRDVETRESSMVSAAQENIGGVRVVKAFGSQKFEVKRFKHLNELLRQRQYDVNKIMAWFWGVSDGLCLSMFALIVVFGVPMAINGEITTGTFVSFLTYTGTLFWPIRHLAQCFALLSQSFIAAERLDEILQTPIETDPEDALRPEITGNIEFRNVSFQYDDGIENVIDDVSFTIEKGETVGILGSTGSGKSSFVHLLLRLYDYTDGEILIDGVPLRKIHREHMRKNASIVLQEPFMFFKSIKDNIALGDLDSDDNAIFEAAKMACVHRTIKRFDKGYDTMLGERGVTLSGGQRQRVAIARTILRKTPILIFDDSLSAVDTKTDQMIRDQLKECQKNTTTIIISHRVSTLADADKIIVFDNGKIIQTGTHETLANTDGQYRDTCILQNFKKQEDAHA